MRRILLRPARRRDASRRPFSGMTLFFTPFDRTRITVREIEKLGRAAVDSNEIFIDGLEVPAEDVVGEVGRGFYHLLDSLNPERVLTGIEAVGIGRAALDRAVQYAKERVVFDRPIGQNQAVAHPLAMAWAKLEAAELLCMKAAWLYDSGRPCGAEANAAKLLSAEAGFEACDAALQTQGATATPRSSRRAPLARGAPLQDRAGVPADGPELPLRARPGAAEELLIRWGAPSGPPSPGDERPARVRSSISVGGLEPNRADVVGARSAPARPQYATGFQLNSAAGS